MRELKRPFLRLVSAEGASKGAPAAPEGERFAIEINSATLKYPIGPYVRGSLKSALMGLMGHRASDAPMTFVDAMKSMTLRISEGERVGLIGANGSGKSSLLRALAGIYPVCEGSIVVRGSIGTLLDIGLGFEAEATGRENIYYRGMSMGFSRAELAAHEEEIIAFAGLDEFIDVPMRTYSAGMSVRLGFAISTQFTPEVMLIDEVFGAGDAAFMKKALERMQAIVDRSGIVVIATHDLFLLERICTRVLWLRKGEIYRDGAPAAVIPEFRAFMDGGTDA
jgi:lipopolysaccharide transport system ATP-binding protein